MALAREIVEKGSADVVGRVHARGVSEAKMSGKLGTKPIPGSNHSVCACVPVWTASTDSVAAGSASSASVPVVIA